MDAAEKRHLSPERQGRVIGGVGRSVRVIGFVLWAATAGSAAAEAPGMSLPAGFRPFHPASPWNTPIPENATVAADSEVIVRRLKEAAGRLKEDHRKWSVPLFVVDAESAPRVSVLFARESNPLLDPDKAGIVRGVPIPAGAWPDPESDGHMLVVDPERMISWDFARARRNNQGSWTVSRLDIWDLKGMGVRRPFTGKGWWTYGARGSGMPLIAGLVRAEDIKAGEIRHALVFSSPITRKSTIPGGPTELCPPASRTDGTHVGPDTLLMGARLQLDPALDLGSLDLSPEVRVIATALKVYGMYNSDSTDKAFKIYLQNLGPDGGAWKTMNFDGLGRIPVERFRVLECPIAIR